MHPVNPMAGTAIQKSLADRPSWFQRTKKGIENINQYLDDAVSKSRVGQWFQLHGSGHVSGSLFSDLGYTSY